MVDHRLGALLCVFVGGILGTAAREALSLTFPSTGISFVTWVINTTGALLLGVLTGAVAADTSSLNRTLRLTLGTGLCGGFTTYSALAEQTANLAGHGAFGAASIHGLGTVVTGALAAWAGLTVGRLVTQHARITTVTQRNDLIKQSRGAGPGEGKINHDSYTPAAPHSSDISHPAALEADLD